MPMKLYTVKVMANCLDLSERRVRQLRDEGVISEKQPGLYDLQATVTKYITFLRNGSGKINLDDDLDVCRSDFYSSTDNSGMFWQIPTIQCFHSIVPGSIMDFYPSIGVTRDVGSRPDTSHYALRGLTSCKYLFDDDSTRDEFGDPETGENTLMPGWSYVDHQNGYDIWKNDYYVPMGFSYDSYITRTSTRPCRRKPGRMFCCTAWYSLTSRPRPMRVC